MAKNTDRRMLRRHPATRPPPQSTRSAGPSAADPHTNHNHPHPAQLAGVAAPVQPGPHARHVDQRRDPAGYGSGPCADRPVPHALPYATASVVSASEETPPTPQAPLWFPLHRRRHQRRPQRRCRQTQQPPAQQRQQCQPHRQLRRRQLTRPPQPRQQRPIPPPQYRLDPAGLPPPRDHDPRIAVPPLSPGFFLTSAGRRPFPRRSDTDPRDVSPWRSTPPHQRLMRRWEKGLE